MTTLNLSVLTFAMVILATLSVLVAGLVGNPVLALGIAFAGFGGLVLFANPFLGLAALVAFSHLDGVEKLLLGFLPVSGFKLLTATTTLALMFHAVRMRDHLRETLREPIIIFALLFLVLAFSTIIFADDMGLAANTLRRLLSLVLLPVLIVALADTPEKASLLVWILIVTSLISALILMVEYGLGVTLVAQSDAATTARTAEGVSRSSGGSDYNPTTAAALLLVGVVAALVALFEGRTHRPFLFFVVLVGSGAVILSFARSAALAYGTVILLLAWRYRRERFMPLAALAALLALVAAIPFIPEEYWERLGSIFGGSADWTLNRRLTYNRIGVDLIRHYPVFGVGPGQFYAHFVDDAYRHLPGRTLLGRELHNMYLSVLVQYGFIGALPFFAMIAFAFRRLRAIQRAPATETLRVQAVALTYALIAYLIASLFLPNEYTKYTWVLVGIAAALFITNRKQTEAS